MRTSLNEIKNIELQLQNAKKDRAEYLIWKSELIANPGLKKKVKWQERAYQMIRYIGRKRMKNELNILHQDLMSSSYHAHFQLKVRAIFPNL